MVEETENKSEFGGEGVLGIQNSGEGRGVQRNEEKLSSELWGGGPGNAEWVCGGGGGVNISLVPLHLKKQPWRK